jgi:ABC-2 type transport system ATP-binding protein
MKVGEQCLYLAQMKKQAKKQLEYWFEKLEIQGWWNKKIQELSKECSKIQFVVCVLHKPKLLILTNLFWIRPCECKYN